MSSLSLNVVLAAVDKITKPLRAGQAAAKGLATEVSATRRRIDELNKKAKQVDGYRTLSAQTGVVAAKYKEAQQKAEQLSREMARSTAPTKEQTKALQDAQRAAADLKRQSAELAEKQQRMRTALNEAGLSTRQLSSHQRTLRADLAAANATLEQQKAKLAAVAAQERRLSAARESASRARQTQGTLAGHGAAQLATAYALSRPLAGVVNAFAPTENAATQLKGAMMASSGEVAADFAEITKLADELGSKLPGTTADFQQMMTMLRRQGMTAKSILGGLGEATSYIGVQLEMPYDAAAEFSAKMQDATRTAEKDMMGLMDTIQRAYYLGVDSSNMLQGFTKISPVMGVIRKDGLAAAKELAPLLVMMDQAGMAGESAGNAYRKVFQAAMSREKVSDANDILDEFKVGFRFDFTDGKGEFKSLPHLFAQLQQLNKLDTVTRLEVIKELFGDDAETLQVVNTMMAKGFAGYQEVASKLAQQADLQQRVNLQLGTLTNIMEAAEGNLSNAMAAFGAAIAPELKALITWAGELANKVGAWAKENPKLAATIVKVVAAAAAAAAIMGTLALGMAAVMGPFIMMRLGATLLGIRALPMLGAALLWVGKAFLVLGRALLLNPIGLTITAVATLAYVIYRYWGPIKDWMIATWGAIWSKLVEAWDGIKAVWNAAGAWFSGLWAGISRGWSNLLGKIRSALSVNPFEALSEYGAGLLSKLAELPDKAANIGRRLIGSLLDAVKSQFAHVQAVVDKLTAMIPAWLTGEDDAELALATPNAAPQRRMDYAPLMARSSPAASYHTEISAPITIVQQPGENQQTLAARMTAELKQVVAGGQARPWATLTDID